MQKSEKCEEGGHENYEFGREFDVFSTADSSDRSLVSRNVSRRPVFSRTMPELVVEVSDAFGFETSDPRAPARTNRLDV